MSNDNGSAIIIPSEVAIAFLTTQREIASALVKAAAEGLARIAESKERMQKAGHDHELRLLEKKAELMKLEKQARYDLPRKGLVGAKSRRAILL